MRAILGASRQPIREAAPFCDPFLHYARECRTAKQFKRLLMLLHSLIPYQSLICAWGYPRTYRVVNMLSLGYPKSFLRWYFTEGMLRRDPVFAEWVQTGKPQVWGEMARRCPQRFDPELVEKVQKDGLEWSLCGGIIEKMDHEVGCYLVLVMASEEGSRLYRKRFGRLLPALTEAFRRSYPRPGLTERERTVLKLRSQGHPVKAIAGELSISPRTVKMHVEAAKKKLYTDDLVNAVVIAMKLGMV